MANAAEGSREATLVTPARGSQELVEYTLVRTTPSLEISDADGVIATQVVTNINVCVTCEGAALVDPEMAKAMGIAPATYAVLSFWEVPGRFDLVETAHFSPVVYSSASHSWQPLCPDGDTAFWAASAAPYRGSTGAHLCVTPSFTTLVAALLGAPAA